MESNLVYGDARWLERWECPYCDQGIVTGPCECFEIQWAVEWAKSQIAPQHPLAKMDQENAARWAAIETVRPKLQSWV